MIIIKVLLYYIINYKWQILFYSAGAAEIVTFIVAILNECLDTCTIVMFVTTALAIIARFNINEE